MTPVYHHAIAVSRQAEMISDLESNDPPIPMKELYHKAIEVAIQTETISVIESAILRFQRHDSIIISSQSPKNRDDIGFGISDPPILMTPVYHHAIAVSRQAEMISDLESNDPPIPITGLYHQAIGVSIQKETISDLESAIL
ncbi:hypothetical protein AVEN_180357-1 [Araneus ventricosus]|uniref:Uncharacterized protein n=1 Tax=Araneus ventricosus TaxID=182803 RepID=A0A4Y2EL25_ARAVE|nr:hypothetical protein AVEN_180357-1 [Araneus ventricosus]